MKIATAVAAGIGIFTLASGNLVLASLAFTAAMLFWLKSE